MIVALFHRQNDEGYEVLLGRLKVASRTVDEIRGFWKERSVHHFSTASPPWWPTMRCHRGPVRLCLQRVPSR